MTVIEARFSAASERDRLSGLIGFATIVTADGYQLDGLAVRRTLEGRLTLSYPVRQDRRGGQHPVFRPTHDRARLDLERQVFERLALEDAS